MWEFVAGAIAASVLRGTALAYLVHRGFRPVRYAVAFWLSSTVWITCQLMTNELAPWLLNAVAPHRQLTPPFVTHSPPIQFAMCTMVDIWLQYLAGVSLMVATLTHRIWALYNAGLSALNSGKASQQSVTVTATDAQSHTDSQNMPLPHPSSVTQHWQWHLRMSHKTAIIRWMWLLVHQSMKRLGVGFQTLPMAALAVSFALCCAIELSAQDSSYAQFQASMSVFYNQENVAENSIQGCGATHHVRILVHILMAWNMVQVLVIVIATNATRLLTRLFNFSTAQRMMWGLVIVMLFTLMVADSEPTNDPATATRYRIVVWAMSEIVCACMLYGLMWVPTTSVTFARVYTDMTHAERQRFRKRIAETQQLLETRYVQNQPQTNTNAFSTDYITSNIAILRMVNDCPVMWEDLLDTTLPTQCIPPGTFSCPLTARVSDADLIRIINPRVMDGLCLPESMAGVEHIFDALRAVDPELALQCAKAYSFELASHTILNHITPEHMALLWTTVGVTHECIDVFTQEDLELEPT